MKGVLLLSRRRQRAYDQRLSRCQGDSRKNQEQDCSEASVVQPSERGESHLRHPSPTILLPSIPREGPLNSNHPPTHPSSIAFATTQTSYQLGAQAQPQPEHSTHRQEATLVYINPRPLQITYIETNQPHQSTCRFKALPPPPNPPPPPQTTHQLQMQQPKIEPHPENQIGPHTLLPTITMILRIVGGSTMEF